MARTLHIVPQTVVAAAARRKRTGFAFGRAFFVLLIVNLIWIGPAIMQPRFLWGMAIGDVALLLLWLVDLLRMPAPQKLRVERSWSHALLLHTPVSMTLAVHNDSPNGLYVDVVDDLAPAVSALPLTLSMMVPAMAKGEVTTKLTALQRGDVSLATTYLRYQSAWRLAEKWAQVDLAQTVRVFPRSNQGNQQSLYLLKSRRLEMEKRFLKRKGIGREFECLREYHDGDAFRDISWTATARRGKWVVKEHQIERSQPIWVVVDCGRLMRMRSGDMSNLDHATSAALNVAQVALFGGDRVGSLLYGLETQATIAPNKGPGHLRVLMEQLALAKEEAAEANHLQAASRLLSAQSRRSLVIWFTDLADTAMTPDVVEGASRLLGRHLVLFAVMQNEELKATAQAQPDNTDDMFRWTAAQEIQQRRDALLARLRAQGAHTLEVPAAGLPSAVVERYLQIKEKNLL